MIQFWEDYIQHTFCHCQVSGGVTERSRLLAQLTDTLESVKSEMEERGALTQQDDL